MSKLGTQSSLEAYFRIPAQRFGLMSVDCDRDSTKMRLRYSSGALINPFLPTEFPLLWVISSIVAVELEF